MRIYPEETYNDKNLLNSLIEYAQSKNEKYLEELKAGKHLRGEAEQMLTIIEFKQERLIEKYCS